MRFLDKNNLGHDEDWYGNNVAVRCFACGKVFLASQVLHRKGRTCPAVDCGKTVVRFTRAGVTVSEAGDGVVS